MCNIQSGVRLAFLVRLYYMKLVTLSPISNMSLCRSEMLWMVKEWDAHVMMKKTMHFTFSFCDLLKDNNSLYMKINAQQRKVKLL